jgi:hypothetical protein
MPCCHVLCAAPYYILSGQLQLVTNQCILYSVVRIHGMACWSHPSAGCSADMPPMSRSPAHKRGVSLFQPFS